MRGTIEVVVGRIGKPHGVKGEVSVELRTDEPERRFAGETVLATQQPPGTVSQPPAHPSSLTVRATRWHQSRLLVTFAEVTDRTSAEAARGLLLVATVDLDDSPEDPEEFYDHQLIGFRVVTSEGEPVGELCEILHRPGQDLLGVRAADGRELLVPFVSQLVPEVDVPNGQIVVRDLPGLLTPRGEDPPGEGEESGA